MLAKHTATANISMSPKLLFIACEIPPSKKAKVFVGVNPFDDFKLLPVNNNRVRFLSQEEAKLLLNEIRKRSEQLYEISIFCARLVEPAWRVSAGYAMQGQTETAQSEVNTVTPERKVS